MRQQLGGHDYNQLPTALQLSHAAVLSSRQSLHSTEVRLNAAMIGDMTAWPPLMVRTTALMTVIR